MQVGITALAIAVAGCTAAHAQQKNDSKIDPKADELLRKMSDSLASTKSMTFDVDHVLEAVTKDGEMLQFVARSRVAVQRPNKARSDRIGKYADATFYYDGKRVAIYGKRKNMYATAPAPGNLDDALDFARDEIGLEAPAADLVYSDVYAGLMQDVVSGTYLGAEPIDNRMCHHLAYRGKEVDWQIWIEDTPAALPCRYVITSKLEKGAPSFQVSFDNWKIDPKLSPTYFEFKPPKGATEIEFLALRADKLQGKAQTQRRKP